MVRALLLCAVIASVGLGGWLVYGFLSPANLSRRPAQLDALRAAILKETHLEADIRGVQSRDQVDLTARVNVIFPHVPQKADKPMIERTVRALVKDHLPGAAEIDVQFGDNLGATPLPSEKDPGIFGF